MRASAVKRWRGGGLRASAGFSPTHAYVQTKIERTSDGSHVLWQQGGFMGRGKNLNLTPSSRKAHRAEYDRDYRAAARLSHKLTLEKRKARDSEMAELQLKALEALEDINAKQEETALGATAVFKKGLASAAVLTPLPALPPLPPLTRPPPLVIPLRAQARKQQRNPTPAVSPAPRHSALRSGTSSPHSPGPSTQLRLNVAREKGFGTTPRYCSDSTPMCQLTR
jgi:hypothetical protein